MIPQEKTSKSLAVVGGGLAGMAAAAAARARGFRVELFEQSQTLGGRAGSIWDATVEQRIDQGQHVAMGCCTALMDFCRQAGIDGDFERCRQLHFLAPDGRQCDVAPVGWLPAPLHLLPGLFHLRYLSLGQRWKIAKTLKKLQRLSQNASFTVEKEKTFGDWLREEKHSARAIDQFWSVVLTSALSETIDRADWSAACKVFCDGFLAHRGASDVLLPKKPLGAIFGDRVGRWLSAQNVTIHCNTPVRRIEGDAVRATELWLNDGVRRPFDAVVVAVPWWSAGSLLSDSLRSAMPELDAAARLEPAAITAVHVWFDRPVTRLPHAVLVGRIGQWVFLRSPKPSARIGDPQDKKNYCQVIVSASHRLPSRTPDEWRTAILDELRAIWPAAREATVLHHRVIGQPRAVFSVSCGSDARRPPQRTAVENLALAGDWTSTGWPGTMEGAVRSGRLAVDRLVD
ncbi:MAG: hydroxysqualene dehydroxylase HpnE [Thermoguttaceae bacterium]